MCKAAVALRGALDLIAKAGCGGRGVSTGHAGQEDSAPFLYNATRSLFEQAGFSYERSKGKKPLRDAQDGLTQLARSATEPVVRGRESWRRIRGIQGDITGGHPGRKNAQMFGQRHRVYNARPLLVFRSSRFHRQALPQS